MMTELVIRIEVCPTPEVVHKPTERAGDVSVAKIRRETREPLAQEDRQEGKRPSKAIRWALKTRIQVFFEKSRGAHEDVLNPAKCRTWTWLDQSVDAAGQSACRQVGRPLYVVIHRVTA